MPCYTIQISRPFEDVARQFLENQFTHNLDFHAWEEEQMAPIGIVPSAR